MLNLSTRSICQSLGILNYNCANNWISKHVCNGWDGMAAATPWVVTSVATPLLIKHFFEDKWKHGSVMLWYLCFYFCIPFVSSCIRWHHALFSAWWLWSLRWHGYLHDEKKKKPHLSFKVIELLLYRSFHYVTCARGFCAAHTVSQYTSCTHTHYRRVQ